MSVIGGLTFATAMRVVGGARSSINNKLVSR